ncbi:MAG: flagellar motor switch protein FliN [Robiginitomaculum sp.]|nr:MAG: flagellar motor switch protein FliN [Robiginitomaculum sp.]
MTKPTNQNKTAGPGAQKKPQDPPLYEQRSQDDGNQYKRSIYALDVKVQVVIGTARPTIGELLQMKQDTLISLDCKLEDPVDLVVDSRVIARGELIETNPQTGEIGVKLTEIVNVSLDVL